MNFEKILDGFGVEFRKSGNKLIGPCPIHEGDNESAFNLTISGKYEGNWFCNTMRCHEQYPGFKNLAKELMRKTGQYFPLESLEFKKKDPFQRFWMKDPIIPCLERYSTTIPSFFYQKRGFSPEILREFEVGDCFQHGTMYNRAVFPVYSMNGIYMGSVGRSLNEGYIKWKNSPGLEKAKTFYGIWKTWERVKEKGSIVLVEGQGDFLKLYQNGVDNCAGMFSNYLCDDQIKILYKLGVHTIILLRDNDQPGYEGYIRIRQKVKDCFHLICPKYNAKDVGELPDNELMALLPSLGV